MGSGLRASRNKSRVYGEFRAPREPARLRTRDQPVPWMVSAAGVIAPTGRAVLTDLPTSRGGAIIAREGGGQHSPRNRRVGERRVA